MQKILNLIVLSIVVCLFNGCATSYISQPSSPFEVTAKAVVEPDIQIGEMIDGTATVNRYFFFFLSGPGKFAEGINYGNNYQESPVSSGIFGDSTVQAKAAAAYQACVQNKADFIICPRYYIIQDDYFFFKRTRAKVYGYKGILTGVNKHTSPQPVIQPVEVSGSLKVTNVSNVNKVSVQTDADSDVVSSVKTDESSKQDTAGISDILK